MTTTEKPAWAKSSYVVTIKREKDRFWARTKNGTWRAWAGVARCDLGKPLALQIFHAEEVKSVIKNEDGSETAEIWEG